MMVPLFPLFPKQEEIIKNAIENHINDFGSCLARITQCDKKIFFSSCMGFSFGI